MSRCVGLVGSVLRGDKTRFWFLVSSSQRSPDVNQKPGTRNQKPFYPLNSPAILLASGRVCPAYLFPTFLL
jgi:hypothetical protein